MKNLIVSKFVSFAAAGAISLTALVAEEALEPVGNMADQLEEAIFLQEAKSDLNAAIKKYQEVLSTDSVVRKIAAEAQFRLAECYWEQGNKIQAQIEYEKLISTYPDEEHWVNAANDRLPSEFKPSVYSIVDGERFLYQYTLPTGVVAAHSEAKIIGVEAGGRKLWRRMNRMDAGGRRMLSVEFDRDSYEPLRSRMWTEQTGEVVCDFSKDGGAISVEYEKSDEAKELSFAGATFDNEQAGEIFRSFPVELGYRTELNVFASTAGVRMPVVCEVVDILEMDTVLGVVECYEVRVEVGGMTQHAFITNDDRRIPVKFKVGGLEINLLKADVYVPGKIRTYSNERYGFSFEYEDEWSLFENSQNHTRTLERIHVLVPGGRGWMEVHGNANAVFDLIVEGDFEATVKALAEQEQPKWKGFDFGEDAYEITKINGMDAALFRGTRMEDGEAVEEFAACFMLGKEAHYIVLLKGATKEWDVLERGFMKIVESFSE